MKKLAIKPGEYVSVNQVGSAGHCLLAQVFVDGKSACDIDATKDSNHANSLAKLIADAANTAQKCALTPSELLSQRNTLVSALESVVSLKSLILLDSDIGREHFDEAVALDEMMGKIEEILNKVYESRN